MTDADVFQIEGLRKSFSSPDGSVLVFDDLKLVVRFGEFVAIVGPSGCGKSTLLRLMAGLEEPTGGRVLFEGVPIVGPPRGVGYLPQTYDLFPWKTVAGNIAVGLLQSHLPKIEQVERIADLMRQTGLSGFAAALPRHLSGGMRQRVALARTLATPPKSLLLDEPFGALDAQTRETLARLVRAVFDEKMVRSAVLVTHDLDEAVNIADRIVVFSRRPARILYTSATRRGSQSAPTNESLVAESRRLLASQAI